MVEREGKEGKGGWRQGSLPGLPPSLVVYVKHAHPDSEKTRLDTWSGTIQPTYAKNNHQKFKYISMSIVIYLESIFSYLLDHQICY